MVKIFAEMKRKSLALVWSLMHGFCQQSPARTERLLVTEVQTYSTIGSLHLSFHMLKLMINDDQNDITSKKTVSLTRASSSVYLSPRIQFDIWTLSLQEWTCLQMKE